jgi:multiple sugar transport system permease protein
MIETARLDGCSDSRILFAIVYPPSEPAIMTVVILTFMGARPACAGATSKLF